MLAGLLSICEKEQNHRDFGIFWDIWDILRRAGRVLSAGEWGNSLLEENPLFSVLSSHFLGFPKCEQRSSRQQKGSGGISWDLNHLGEKWDRVCSNGMGIQNSNCCCFSCGVDGEIVGRVFPKIKLSWDGFKKKNNKKSKSLLNSGAGCTPFFFYLIKINSIYPKKNHLRRRFVDSS